MYFWCLIVATPNEWADEVIVNNQNWFLLKDSSVEEIKKWIELWIENLLEKEKFSVVNEEIIQKKFRWNQNIIELYNIVK